MTNPVEAQAILRGALADVVAELGKPARLDVGSLNVSGAWAFLYARIEEPDGKLVDYAGTKFDGEQRSSVYAALLRGGAGQWDLAASVIGPTDMAWWNWGEKYSAPAEVFEISGN
ncbi:hypothetical protein [Segniliparus rugosus]|uniref:Immunity protein 35 domain-containing protein n=1 Tax=Segniliparus rugosus (strain ATCC BAA-974 / DSM 45345 / CCUG 50838 / CIP 108380 / JCM 13579 / CDC 945) TaxID=679197 RepID=E5XN26_SEGRC|nr:hypothetical protein [Segniliparus rugosus]EFV14251.1 hypothetical protein HMPREF9336_00896 [Segniliparus rugosus ATCC BAA-974]